MQPDRPHAVIWAIILLATGFAANLFLMCGSNLVAFAVVAAMTLGLRRGSLVALGIWLESQVLGFTVFGYPHETMTVAWGIALGAGTMLCAAVSGACAARGSLAAFVAAFVAYELALAAFALAIGSGLSAFTPEIVGGLCLSNALLAAGGLVLYRLLAIVQGTMVRTFARARQA